MDAWHRLSRGQRVLARRPCGRCRDSCLQAAATPSPLAGGGLGGSRGVQRSGSARGGSQITLGTKIVV